MACKHKQLKCVNCVFYCLDCGAQVKAPKPAKQKNPAEKTVGEKTEAEKGATKE